MDTSKYSKKGNVANLKNSSTNFIKENKTTSGNDDKNKTMEKFHEIYRQFENGKIDAKTFKGKIKTELGANSKNSNLDEILNNDKLDKNNFVNIIKESNILKDENSKKMPDYTPILQRSSLNMDYHKRFRHQKTILFENRTETTIGKSKKIAPSLKDGVQNFIKGQITENEFKTILKENNVDASTNEIQKQIKSMNVGGENQAKDLMFSILKYKNEEKNPKELSHGTFVDFTPKTDYKDPLGKITKRLYQNNQNHLTDKRNFYWFDCDDTPNSAAKPTGHYRNSSSINITSNNNANEKKDNSNLILRPSDPSLNKINKKNMMHSSRNNMESNSFLNDLRMRSSSTSFIS